MPRWRSFTGNMGGSCSRSWLLASRPELTYLNLLANEADEWFTKRPGQPALLARRFPRGPRVRVTRAESRWWRSAQRHPGKVPSLFSCYGHPDDASGHAGPRDGHVTGLE